MRRYLAITAILAVCGIMLLGCATTQLPKDSTPEQIRAARCQDAVTGLAIANVWLTTKSMTEAENKYWVAYQESAKILVATYCMGQ